MNIVAAFARQFTRQYGDYECITHQWGYETYGHNGNPDQEDHVWAMQQIAYLAAIAFLLEFEQEFTDPARTGDAAFSTKMGYLIAYVKSACGTPTLQDFLTGKLWPYLKRVHVLDGVGTNRDYDMALWSLANVLFLWMDESAIIPDEVAYHVLCQDGDGHGCYYQPFFNIDWFAGYLTFNISDVHMTTYVGGRLNIERNETENHVLSIYGWNYLASLWILLRGHAPPAPGDSPELASIKRWYQKGYSWLMRPGNLAGWVDQLLQALGRPLHAGFFETNARPYQELSLRTILTLVLYADPDLYLPDNSLDEEIKEQLRRVQKGAWNAFAYAGAKFAFQSLRAKRSAPMRRRYQHRYEANFYSSNRTPLLFGLLSGAHDYDDCTDPTDSKCRVFRYTGIDQKVGELYAAMGRLKRRLHDKPSYELPVTVWGQMFDQRPYFAIFQARYWRDQYPVTIESDDEIKPYFLPGDPPTVYEGKGFRGSPELYFGTGDLMLAAGGKMRKYYSGVADAKLNEYTLYARPTMLYGRGDFGHSDDGVVSPSDDKEWPSWAVAADRQALLMFGKDLDTVNSSCNVWAYKSFVYGYDYHVGGGPSLHKPSGWPQLVPDWWGSHWVASIDPEDYDREQNVAFRIYYFHQDELGPGTQPYFVVLAKVWKEHSGAPGNPDMYYYNRGFVEVVPEARYGTVDELVQALYSWNDPSFLYFRHREGDGDLYRYKYVTLTSHERLFLDPRMGWAGMGEWEGCRSGIRRVQELADPTSGPAGSDDDSRWVDVDRGAEYIPLDVDSDSERKKIPLARVWELDTRHQKTGHMLMESVAPGKVVVRRRAMVVTGPTPAPVVRPGWQCLVLDSSDYRTPTHQEFTSVDYRDCAAPDFDPYLAKTVSAGTLSTCATTKDGHAYCWGDNSAEQLGVGPGGPSYADQAHAVWPPGALNGKIVLVTTGRAHACALDVYHQVWCWGEGDYGQLGNGQLQSVAVPTLVQVGSHPLLAQAVVAGGWHTCALGQLREVYCWGDNQLGELGQPADVLGGSVPLRVQGLVGKPVVALAAGGAHTCAITDIGSLYCWGANGRGQIGDGTETDRFEPVRPVFGRWDYVGRVDAVTTGFAHTCAVTRVEYGIRRSYCWGDNRYGQLGATVPNGANSSATPLRVAALGSEANSSTPLVSLSAGLYHTCALDEDRAIWCWGDNRYGQLGDGGFGSGGATAVRVANALTARVVSAGGLHTCAVDEDQVTWCWGANSRGQLGAAEAPSALPASASALPVVWE